MNLYQYVSECISTKTFNFSNFTVVVPVAAKAAKAIDDAAESPPWEELTTEPPPKVGSWEMSKRQSQANLTKVTDPI